MALDRESIEIALFLQEYRQLHRYVNGVDIIEDVFRPRYIAAGWEGILACLSESESRIVLLLLFRGALDHTTEVQLQVAWNPKDTTELARQHDAENKNNFCCFSYIVAPCCKGVPVGKRVLNS